MPAQQVLAFDSSQLIQHSKQIHLQMHYKDQLAVNLTDLKGDIEPWKYQKIQKYCWSQNVSNARFLQASRPPIMTNLCHKQYRVGHIAYMQILQQKSYLLLPTSWTREIFSSSSPRSSFGSSTPVSQFEYYLLQNNLIINFEYQRLKELQLQS